MASNGNTGYFVFITVFLALAVGALVAFRTGSLSFGNLLDPVDIGGGGGVPLEDGAEGPNADPTPKEPDSSFDLEMPKDRSLEVSWGSSLKKTIEVTRIIEGREVKMKLKLVPQGWFPMGENDGVIANGPKKWIWASDYYMAETETTNDQYFAFISEDGYSAEKGHYWDNQDALAWVLEKRRGSGLIGWRQAILGNDRLWVVTSPRNENSIVVFRPSQDIPRPDTTLVVLPTKHDAAKWLSIDVKQGAISFFNKGTKRWEMMEPKLALQRLIAEKSDLVHKTNGSGKIFLDKQAKGVVLRIVAFADGDTMRPLFARVATQAYDRLREPNMPVVSVTWFGASACSRYWGGGLPKEYQWEKAARGPKGWRYPWGNDLELTNNKQTDRANFNRHKVQEAGSFPEGVGTYGHLDLIGNVSEYCFDVYKERVLDDDVFKEADPYNKGLSSQSHSQRGSSSDDEDLSLATSYFRQYSDPYTLTNRWRGFRVAYSPEQAYRAAGLRLPAKN
ncbi:MAG: SUMF1/EgtB/PvdO family nonheme iron enzyme [Planctomycetota bacterium]